MRRIGVLVVGLSFLLSCDPDGGDGPEPDEGAAGKADGATDALHEGTPEAIGVLRMLAEPSTDLEALDHVAGLDRRAAENLLAHRDGPDGIYEEGAGDDQPFGSIAEVDAVSWVGPSALSKLLAFALQNDFVPGGGQHLGTWDGIDFTAAEAIALVGFVNAASESELYDVLRDSRPHDGLLAARPVSSVLQIAGVKWIGPVMLGRLKDASAGEPGGEACESAADCATGLQCVGKPSGSTFGLCRDLSPISGEDDACLATADCESGLQCSGTTIYDEGFCRPAWMATTIEDGGAASIPGIVMAEPMGMGVTAIGLASVPEDILVTVNLQHSHPESLWLGLRDPNGDEALLWDGPNAGGAPFSPTMSAGWGISRDDQVNGQWFLLVRNVGGQGDGMIDGWSLSLTSRWD